MRSNHDTEQYDSRMTGITVHQWSMACYFFFFLPPRAPAVEPPLPRAPLPRLVPFPPLRGCFDVVEAAKCMPFRTRANMGNEGETYLETVEGPLPPPRTPFRPPFLSRHCVGLEPRSRRHSPV